MVVHLVLRAVIRSYLTLSSCNQRKSVIHTHINCAVKYFYLLLVDVHAGIYITECSNEGIIISVKCSFCRTCVICPIISYHLFPSQSIRLPVLLSFRELAPFELDGQARCTNKQYGIS